MYITRNPYHLLVHKKNTLNKSDWAHEPSPNSNKLKCYTISIVRNRSFKIAGQEISNFDAYN